MANNIMRFFGTLKELDWEEKKENIRNLRISFNKKL